jgi:hypothetical protein
VEEVYADTPELVAEITRSLDLGPTPSAR